MLLLCIVMQSIDGSGKDDAASDFLWLVVTALILCLIRRISGL